MFLTGRDSLSSSGGEVPFELGSWNALKQSLK